MLKHKPKFKIVPVKTGGRKGKHKSDYLAWQVICNNPGDGKRFRKTFRSKAEADDELMKQLYAADAYQFDTPRFSRQTYLSEKQIAFAEEAYTILSKLTFEPAVDPPNNATKKPQLLVEAAELYVQLRRNVQAQSTAKLSDALQGKKGKNSPKLRSSV